VAHTQDIRLKHEMSEAQYKILKISDWRM